MFQVLLFEGIPGSGKTTFSKRIKKYLNHKGYQPIIFHEGDIHPIDLAWCSYMDEETFQVCLDKYEHLQDQIMDLTEKKGDYYVTAYTRIKVNDKKDLGVYEDFSKHEIYKFHDLDRFKKIHKNLYQHFNQKCKKNDIYIFECVLLQNHFNELILRYHKDKSYMIDYFNDLLDQLSNIRIQIIHLQQENVERDLKKIIEERTPETMNIPKNWVDLVIDYLDQQPYARKLGYVGEQGVYDYYSDRQSLEKDIIPHLHTNIKTFTVNQNYDEVYQKIIQFIEKEWI